MIIRAVYIGNSEEAYINKEFKEGLNIISSDDNNKGKTIVIQAIMYCLGNIPAFPSAFDYENYCLNSKKSIFYVFYGRQSLGLPVTLMPGISSYEKQK